MGPAIRGATLAAAMLGIAAAACGDAPAVPQMPAGVPTAAPTTPAPPQPPQPPVADAGAPTRGSSEPAAVYGGPPPR